MPFVCLLPVSTQISLILKKFIYIFIFLPSKHFYLLHIEKSLFIVSYTSNLSCVLEHHDILNLHLNCIVYKNKVLFEKNLIHASLTSIPR